MCTGLAKRLKLRDLGNFRPPLFKLLCGVINIHQCGRPSSQLNETTVSTFLCVDSTDKKLVSNSHICVSRFQNLTFVCHGTDIMQINHDVEISINKITSTWWNDNETNQHKKSESGVIKFLTSLWKSYYVLYFREIQLQSLQYIPCTQKFMF